MCLFLHIDHCVAKRFELCILSSASICALAFTCLSMLRGVKEYAFSTMSANVSTCAKAHKAPEHAVSQDLYRPLNLVANPLRPWPSHCLVLTSVSAAPQIECQPECRLVLRPEHRPVCHKCLTVRFCKNVSHGIDQKFHLHIDKCVSKFLGLCRS